MTCTSLASASRGFDATASRRTARAGCSQAQRTRTRELRSIVIFQKCIAERKNHFVHRSESQRHSASLECVVDMRVQEVSNEPRASTQSRHEHVVELPSAARLAHARGDSARRRASSLHRRAHRRRGRGEVADSLRGTIQAVPSVPLTLRTGTYTTPEAISRTSSTSSFGAPVRTPARAPGSHCAPTALANLGKSMRAPARVISSRAASTER